MAEAVTVARPYAEAVYKLAVAKNNLTEWSSMLQDATVISQHEQVKALIGNPVVSAKQLGELLLEIGKSRFNQEGRNFLLMLAENNRVNVLPQISQLFEHLKSQHEGVLEAIIVSAFEINSGQLKKLVASLEHKFNRKIDAKVQVNPELIGGVIVEVGDEIFDASIRGKLQAMASALKS
ncbi:F0F1 ATP synthase subunit delta [Nitrosomonas sp.]|uniref:F0F1 ATP synthase subunit delta n=1 Tax=Nitrosomonas sp. TaxID=42353 RepID=UPI001D9C9A65|nr:F0F1 ATP synthase subunit delta [Nitrosomonas sp.]MCB1948040.1 F0F1 ATP synthase subunit delta [Nitrosomonas sp.]MCP5243482.1 F0F1 ATP synthase subunit delta [Burkholderiales bacterium]MDR4513513.1 F0F1 ATP synthase subunit delta [Nitrosomonas sp.]